MDESIHEVWLQYEGGGTSQDGHFEHERTDEDIDDDRGSHELERPTPSIVENETEPRRWNIE